MSFRRKHDNQSMLGLILSLFNLYMWIKNVACHISKQRILKQSATAVTLIAGSRETQDGKEQNTGLRWQRCISKEWFQWPQTLDVPQNRKVLNSLIWEIWFSLINGNLLMLQLHDLCCENSSISWVLPCLFWAVPQGYLRICLLGISPQQIH